MHRNKKTAKSGVIGLESCFIIIVQISKTFPIKHVLFFLKKTTTSSQQRLHPVVFGILSDPRHLF